MDKKLLALMAVSTLSLGTAQAFPVPQNTGMPVVQNIDWRRVCDRDGDRCRRVWVRDRDDRIILRFGDRDRNWWRERREREERRERHRDSIGNR